jgi:hypothetical protein
VGDTSTPPAATYGLVSATSTPSGATIWIDAVSTDSVTPCVIDSIETGLRYVKWTLEGYDDAEDTVMVTEGDTAEMDATLESSAPDTFRMTGPALMRWWGQ